MKKILFTTLLSCVGYALSFGQIPNAGFESWTGNNPTGWTTSNDITMPNAITCTQGSPGKVGASYIKLTSKTVSNSVTSGFAVTGNINVMNANAAPGFPYAKRPTDFTGAYKYTPKTGDLCFIYAVLTKWNTLTKVRDTIAEATLTNNSQVSNWTTFTIPFNYKGNAMPDTACILLTSSGDNAVDGSTLSVDDLAFSGGVTGINVVHKTAGGMSVYPNPARDQLAVEFNNEGANANIQLYDVLGNVVYEEKTQDNKNTIDVSQLSKGNYFLKISSDKNVEVQKIVVQ